MGFTFVMNLKSLNWRKKWQMGHLSWCWQVSLITNQFSSQRLNWLRLFLGVRKGDDRSPGNVCIDMGDSSVTGDGGSLPFW